MARTAKVAAPIRFRGIPASLTGVIPEGIDPELDLSVTLKAPRGREAKLEVSVQPDLDPRILRLALPAHVPPGSYPGTLSAGGREREIRLEVDASPLLRVVPEQLRIEAHPGDLVGVELTLLNQGNVPLELRGVQLFGIFMDGGVERALRLAYVRKLKEGERRVDILADNLAQAHGGLVKMKVQKGEGIAEPGALVALEVTLEVPKGLTRGVRYTGNWELPGLVYPVSILIPPVDDEEGKEDGKGKEDPKNRDEGVK